MIFKANERMD